MKNDFEKELQIFLKEHLSVPADLKVNRHQVIIDDRSGTKAEINFTYLNISMEYSISMNVSSKRIQKFIEQIDPPYPSNISASNLVYYSYYLNEKQYFPLMLPTTEAGKKQTFENFLKVFQSIYIPRVFNLIELNEQLINDVKENPKHYSYPFLIGMAAANHNTSIKVDLEELLSKKYLGFENNLDLKMEFNRQLVRNEDDDV
ncbi:hypothetical protein [Xylocopilactobacillus apicola]|uniref:Uncharacterized protein n=1 Tax=Xylocopilactobacillus apicola TaxID=2932184 RepID=A0AAU9CUI5_9LACO|nr:hypothetical protein [Xylocopilactobacillus apicola]BDR57674.1 hypothetical protein XA3_01150 [Xylocopilactobacillus apicola]